MTFQALTLDGARLGCVECTEAAAARINSSGAYRLVPLDSPESI